MSRDPFLFRIFLSAFTVVSCYEEWEEAPTFVMLGKEGRIIYLGELCQMTAIPDQGVSLSSDGKDVASVYSSRLVQAVLISMRRILVLHME